MYVITTNGDSTSADTILGALAAFADQLRIHLPHGGHTSWNILDPAGTDHRGCTDLSGRADQLEHVFTELDDRLYAQLHRSADRAPQPDRT